MYLFNLLFIIVIINLSEWHLVLSGEVLVLELDLEGGGCQLRFTFRQPSEPPSRLFHFLLVPARLRSSVLALPAPTFWFSPLVFPPGNRRLSGSDCMDVGWVSA